MRYGDTVRLNALGKKLFPRTNHERKGIIQEPIKKSYIATNMIKVKWEGRKCYDIYNPRVLEVINE